MSTNKNQITIVLLKLKKDVSINGEITVGKENRFDLFASKQRLARFQFDDNLLIL